MSAIDHPAVVAAELGLDLTHGSVVGEAECLYGERIEVGTHHTPNEPLVGVVDLWADGKTEVFLDAQALRKLAALAMATAELLDPTPLLPEDQSCVDCDEKHRHPEGVGLVKPDQAREALEQRRFDQPVHELLHSITSGRVAVVPEAALNQALAALVKCGCNACEDAAEDIRNAFAKAES